MTNARLDARLSGLIPLLTASVGCLSLQELSSYSEGGAATTEPSSDEPLALAPDAGAADVRAMELQDPTTLFISPDAAVAAAGCAGAGEFTDAASTSCYLLGESSGSWRDGRDFCQGWGGDLAQLVSREENELASERSEDDVWIGAREFDGEGTFRWLDGDELDDASWGPGQPDDYQGREDCVELRASDDNWNDAPCGSEKRALCERPLAGNR
jgi:hypothetical protein